MCSHDTYELTQEKKSKKRSAGLGEWKTGWAMVVVKREAGALPAGVLEWA